MVSVATGLSSKLRQSPPPLCDCLPSGDIQHQVSLSVSFSISSNCFYMFSEALVSQKTVVSLVEEEAVPPH